MVLLMALVSLLVNVALSVHSYSIRNCDNIDETSIFGNDLCGSIIFPDDADYDTARDQYAFTSTSPLLSPSLIIFAECDSDIKLILNYAQKCDYTISIRSGGHQYSGLSSCSSSIQQCIQIDMSFYDDIETIDAVNNIIRIGPGMALGVLADWFVDNGLFLPYGECAFVNIGGHTQTGGFGHIQRSFGALVDYLQGFYIILANGDTKYAARDDEYNDLFWAVAGGSPGAFGVVTAYDFAAQKDSDHPNSGGVKVHWFYDIETLRNVLKQAAIVQSQVATEEFNLDIWFTMLSNPEGLPNLIQLEGTWGDIDGNSPIDTSYWDSIIDAAGTAPFLNVLLSNTPISVIMRELFVFNEPREYPFPYNKQSHGTSLLLRDQFIDAYVEQVDQILSVSSLTTGLFMVTQITFQGGTVKINDIDSKETALNLRNVETYFILDVFYLTAINPNGQQDAAIYQQEAYDNLITSGAFSDGEDRTSLSFTYGNVNIKEVAPIYYDSKSKLRRLIDIKTNVDPKNIFKTSFTVPVKSRKKSPKKSNKYQDLEYQSLNWSEYVFYLISGGALMNLIVICYCSYKQPLNIAKNVN